MFIRVRKTGVFTLVCTHMHRLHLKSAEMFFAEREIMESNEHLRDKHININESHELVYWSEVLQCDQNDIVNAVMKIGTSAKMVDDFLILNRRKNTTRD